jgi:hypothetical protein
MRSKISFIIILCWAIWVITTNGNLKPSDNYLLWVLGAISIMYSTIAIVIYLIELKVKDNE